MDNSKNYITIEINDCSNNEDIDELKNDMLETKRLKNEISKNINMVKKKIKYRKWIKSVNKTHRYSIRFR